MKKNICHKFVIPTHLFILTVLIISMKNISNELKRAKKVKGINNYIGLMFKRNSEPLLFEVHSATKIHSFFCPLFDAVWMDENKKIIRKDRVKPNTFCISAPKGSRYLLEIPVDL